jgi:hypothetical protein
MSAIVTVFGVAIAGLGIFGVIRPRDLVRFVSATWKSPSGLYLAIAVRLILGVALIGAASSSRFPDALRILGILSIITAVVAPILGTERVRAFVEWWAGRPSGLIRAWAAFATVFGVFLVHAVR